MVLCLTDRRCNPTPTIYSLMFMKIEPQDDKSDRATYMKYLHG